MMNNKMGADQLSVFLDELFWYLTEQRTTRDDKNILRKHNTLLETSGDLSFPLNSSAWKNFKSATIQEFLEENSRENAIEKLKIQSKNWQIQIEKCEVKSENKLIIFLTKTPIFESNIKYILEQGNEFGFPEKIMNKTLQFRLDFSDDDFNLMDLTKLRLSLLKKVAENLVKLNLCDSVLTENSELVLLTNKSKVDFDKKITCGVVITNKFGKRNTTVTAEEFYCKRSVDMRLMAEHKYGVRVNSEIGWKEFFNKLGSAAVTFELLHTKATKRVVVNMDNPTASSNKGAAFILYNCARLAEIFKQFDEKVASKIYPPLPDLNEVDFSLLIQPEEWEILYVYLMRYPELVETCLRDLYDYKINVHNLCMFLDSLCLIFSVYYRRVRILVDARDHFIPLIHTRIYFLKGIQQVLHNVLSLLNIPPVKQM